MKRLKKLKMKTSWKDTKIWKLLNSMSGDIPDSVKILLDNPLVMPKIETILAKGGSSSLNFTLHDEEHAFRVAERMFEIIPETTRDILSSYDLMMLLMSAYLHDIGMTPEVKKVYNHFVVITSKDKTNLSEEEIHDFQKWLDNEDVRINIKKDVITDFRKSNELVTYYCRHKHNDWSEEWIDRNFKDIILEGYLNWQKDLINICKSHHYGSDFLINEKLDAKIVKKNCCHRRFVAICLRIADVLEVDPERTPKVLFNHRDISSKSIPYWLKDQEINININSNKISFYARPQKAYLHKAIEETFKQIEFELELVQQVANKKPLNYLPDQSTINYNWDLMFQNVDIKPFEDSYVYIKGAFRPNINKVLNLLAGTELYGTKLASIRELLQNSFDATKEIIAYKRLNNQLLELDYQQKLAEEHLVKLSLTENDEGIWINCSDQGVGMTKSIIENYYLVSGSSQRHQISDLERRCILANISFERTGQFGIGVLSYFMIADKILIRTKRAQDTGFLDEEIAGWEFEIGGIQDFGELRSKIKNNAGTEVSMLLKKDLYADIVEFAKSIEEYIIGLVSKTPCKFKFTVELSKYKNQIEFGVGWRIDTNYLNSLILKEVKRHEYYNEDNKKTLWNIIYDYQYTYPDDFSEIDIEHFNQKIKWEVITGFLPLNYGEYKISIPYFELEDGRSFCYSKVDNSGLIHNVGYDSILEPNLSRGSNLYFGNVVVSINGFAISYKIEDDEFGTNHLYNFSKFPNILYEINLTKNYQITASRDQLLFTNDQAEDIFNFIYNRSLESLKILYVTDSKWNLYNCIFLDDLKSFDFNSNYYWFVTKIHSERSRKSEYFRSIKYPLIIKGDLEGSFCYKIDNHIADICLVSDFLHSNNTDSRKIINNVVNVGLLGNNNLVFFIKESIYDQNYFQIRDYLKVKMPKGWEKLIYISYFERQAASFEFINSNTLNLSNINSIEWEYFDSEISNKDFDDKLKVKILSDIKFSSVLMITIITDYRFKNMLEKQRDFLEDLWLLVFPNLQEVASYSLNTKSIELFSLNGVKRIDNVKNLLEYFPSVENEDIVIGHPATSTSPRL